MELLSLNRIPPKTRRYSPFKIGSAIVHVLLIGSLIEAHHLAMAKVHTKAKSKKITVAYKAGRSAAPAAAPKPMEKAPHTPPKPTDPKPATAATADANGDADVTVALATFFPTPKPDLNALLPHGTKGDVVIDVVIDEDGKVAETRVDQSLGQALDEAVVAVIETWTFEPAMKAGKPVASEQQLLFHYERA
jgi:protein TonB